MQLFEDDGLMAKNTVTLLAVGDVGPIHEPIEAYSALVCPTLAKADIRFAQSERLYSARGELQLHSGVKDRPLDERLASVFTDCGFDVVSVAGNLAMNWGPDALLDTIAMFRKRGIEPIGGGETLEEACRAAVIARNGVKVAFLAFCSVLREGYEAGPNKAGVAPIRAHTYYQTVDYQPGVPPHIVTIPNADDLAVMEAAIAKARAQADVVVLSLHWGIHFIPRLIAEYQPIVARAAFAAGADIIVGHHAHAPKAIGVHDGKVCFYSLSNFIMSSNALPPTPAKVAEFERHYGVKLDPDYPRLPYGPDGQRSVIAKAVMSKSGVERVSFLPAHIDRQLRPEILRKGDPRFDEAVRFMDWVSEDFDHTFTVDGDEVVVS